MLKILYRLSHFKPHNHHEVVTIILLFLEMKRQVNSQWKVESRSAWLLLNTMLFCLPKIIFSPHLITPLCYIWHIWYLKLSPGCYDHTFYWLSNYLSNQSTISFMDSPFLIYPFIHSINIFTVSKYVLRIVIPIVDIVISNTNIVLGVMNFKFSRGYKWMTDNTNTYNS